MFKIFSIVSNIILVLSVVVDVLKDTNISSFVFLGICIIISVYTIIKMLKQDTKISTRVLFIICALVINAYAVIDAFFPSVFENNFAFNSNFSLIMYLVFLVASIVVDKQIKGTNSNNSQNTEENT